MRRWFAVLLLIAAHPILAADAPAVPYPAGYRTWQHVKSMLIEPGHPLAGLVEGLHHIYANPQALAGYRSGRYRDGAVIVLDLLQPLHADRAMTEGARKAVIVMHKDSRRYTATGGWGFEVFAGDSHDDRRVGNQATQQCFACHTARQAQGYVFSEYRN
ncbi:MAG: cytochrome P460 family protein [Gammaproteobacteria bacterium]|nr:cytochrome P460 family protein [Gammaproteobacteria bacterium]